MASIAHQKAIITISYVESLAISILEWYRKMGRSSEEVTHLCSRLRAQSDTAIVLYPRLDPREVREIEVKVSALNDYINGIDGTEAAVGTSLMLALIVDLLEHAKDSRKRRAIEGMYSTVKRLHRYFDRTGKREDYYDLAWRAYLKHLEILPRRVDNRGRLRK